MKPKPEWLRIRHTDAPDRAVVEKILEDLNLNTVCKEAMCPNYLECFARKTATFMILGTNCTRNCRFCNVRHAKPQPPDPNEPDNIAGAVKKLELSYVVITSVTRDDLPDGGANHFAKVIGAIKKSAPGTVIEVLIPDLNGDVNLLKIITDASPSVISHNMETVFALYSDVRPQAEYTRSLHLLENIKKLNPTIHSKSGFMVGLGESKVQVLELLDDLRLVGCEFLTIGQYLAPSKEHYPIREYIHPHIFDEYGAIAKEKGFHFVASAPLVRSSYRADEAIKESSQSS